MAKKKNDTSGGESNDGGASGKGEVTAGKYDLLGTRRKGYLLSAILILVSLASLGTRGLNWGIDFSGGSLYWYCFEDAAQVTAEKIRAHFADFPQLGKATVQQVEATDSVGGCGEGGKGIQYLIFTGFVEAEAKDDPIPKIEARFEKELGGASQVKSLEIGPTIGNAIRKDAIKALLLAVGFMLLYIAIRFEFRWGVAAVVALVHDCLIVIGVFSLLQREINSDSLAALLTIIGYSLNDTIVIIDRVRENMGVHSLKRKLGYEGVFNLSVNQSISRTLNTSVTTLFPVTALLLFGGLVIRDFALALFVGVLAGTYSSIWVVSALLVDWYYKDHPGVAAKDKAKS